MTASVPRTHPQSPFDICKAAALRTGDKVGVFAPASPAGENRVLLGLKELTKLGFAPEDNFAREPQGYFSATADARLSDFMPLLNDPHIAALFALRGGYGSYNMLEELWKLRDLRLKCIVGYSAVTSLQILLWQRLGWVSFYGPMVAAGLEAGAN